MSFFHHLNKKAYLNWLTPLLLLLLILGFIIAYLTPTAWVSYSVLLVTGSACGFLLPRRKKISLMAALLLMLGFVMGYMLGEKELSRFTIVVVFFVSVGVGLLASNMASPKKRK